MPQLIVASLFPALVGTTAGTILTGVVGIGLSIGLNLLIQALTPQPKPADIQSVYRQTAGARMRHYGTVRVGGSLAFLETKDGSLFQIIVHGQGPVDAWHEIFIDNRLVELQLDGGVTTAPYNPAIQFLFEFDGTDSQAASSDIIGYFPSIWTSAHQLKGMFYSVFLTGSVKAEDLANVYPNRIPVLNRVVDTTIAYDPRTAGFAFTKNPALIMRDYLTHPDGMGIPDALVDDDLIATAATVCDEVVTFKDDSTAARYFMGMSYSFDEEPKDILMRIINTCDGRLFITSEGKIGFQAGKWAAPSVTIDDTAGHIIEAELTHGGGPFSQANEVIVKFTQIEAGFREATSDPWRDEDNIDLTGAVLSQTMTAYEIQSHNQARRIAKIVQRRSTPEWQGTIRTTLHGLNAWDQRWINLVYPDLEIDDTFEIIGPPALDPETMTITFQVQSFDSSTYDFDADTEEGTAPAIPEELADEDIPVPTGVVTDDAIRKLGEVEFTDSVYDPIDGPSTNPQTQDLNVYVATIEWDAAPWLGLDAEAQYTLNGGLDWYGIPLATDGLSGETGPIAAGTVVGLRVRWRSLGGGASAWTVGSDVTIPG